MTFGAPLLGLAALTSWLPILWLHRRRREAPTVLVPSLVPWLALLAPPVPRRRRIRASWLLAIHLVIAASLAAAVARPAIAGRRPVGGALALVLDVTTSMGARQRWAEANAAVREAIDGAGGPYTLVTAGPAPRVLVTRARSAAPVLAALARQQPLGTGGDLGAAAGLARAAAGDAARLVVVTDGGGQGDVGPGARVVVVDVGGSAANVAVVAAAAQRDPDRGETRVTARVANYGGAERDVAMTLRVDGQPADEQVVSLGPREARALAWRVRPDAREAEVRLSGDDDLAVDDVAHVWLLGRPVAVQMVGESEPVARALAADRDVEMERAGPATLRADGSVDVTVVADMALGRLPPGGVLWIAPPPGADAEAGPGAARIAVVGDHPLVDGLDLGDALLGGLTVRDAPPWAEPMLVAGDYTAAYAGVREGRREVVLAFDPALGDVALRVGFPRLVRRILGWLAAPARADALPTLGGRLQLLVPADVEGPDGARHREVGWLPLDRPGLYQIDRAGRPPSVIAVNAGDARESDLVSRAMAPREAMEGAATAGAARPIWRWLVLLALALAALESAWRGAPTRPRAGA